METVDIEDVLVEKNLRFKLIEGGSYVRSKENKKRILHQFLLIPLIQIQKLDLTLLDHLINGFHFPHYY